MKQYNKGRIQSLKRGIEILKCFTPEEPVLRLVDLSNKLKISKSTLFRYVSTLEDLGYLNKNKSIKSYTLNIKVLDLGFTALKGLGLSDISSPYVDELAHQCQESASIAVLDGFYIVYIVRSATKRWMSTNLQIGSKLPAYCTSLGKVLFAYMCFSDVKEVIKKNKLTAYTQYTITDMNVLEKELKKIRKNGYAVSDQELELGLLSAAAPIYNKNKEVFAAINISMSSARITTRKLKKIFIPYLIETAINISDKIYFY